MSGEVSVCTSFTRPTQKTCKVSEILLCQWHRQCNQTVHFEERTSPMKLCVLLFQIRHQRITYIFHVEEWYLSRDVLRWWGGESTIHEEGRGLQRYAAYCWLGLASFLSTVHSIGLVVRGKRERQSTDFLRVAAAWWLRSPLWRETQRASLRSQTRES
jgi:hypothetical protein